MNKLISAYYQGHPALYALYPFAKLYQATMAIRRRCYQSNIFKRTKLPVPVIVVGNITLGGTGKTPVVIWLANCLKSQGYKPGIVSRGYTATCKNFPASVSADANPVIYGDEPVLIAKRSQCPVVIDPIRVNAAKYLLQEADCDVIISDDGLQHYALARDIEIAVVDGERRLGNGLCLPAGPLREASSRLTKVDYILNNGGAANGEILLNLVGDTAINLQTGAKQHLSGFQGQRNLAFAGIGNPPRFFNHLQSYGLDIEAHTFPDHHQYQQSDLQTWFDIPQINILMTEKDAVKCQTFANSHCWYVPVTAKISEDFGQSISQRLQTLKPN